MRWSRRLVSQAGARDGQSGGDQRGRNTGLPRHRALRPRPDVLRAIDQAIPFPLIFEVVHGGRVELAAAYKRSSEADSTRWVVGDYFQGDWLPEHADRAPLPVALNMGALYEQLLAPLVAGQTARLVQGISEAPQMPFTPADGDRPVSLEERIAQAEAIKAQTREIERIKTRLRRERQFNKRVTINAELRAAKQKLNRLTGGTPVPA